MVRCTKSFVSSGQRRAAALLAQAGRCVPTFEQLESHHMLAITALFSPAAGALSVLGDGDDNAIAVSRDAVGNIGVNGGAVPIVGGAPSVAADLFRNFRLMIAILFTPPCRRCAPQKAQNPTRHRWSETAWGHHARYVGGGAAATLVRPAVTRRAFRRV